MIKFKDFMPNVTEKNFAGLTTRSDSLFVTMKRVNHWIDSNSVEILNVETIMIPCGQKESSVVSDEGLYATTAYLGHMRSQGVRVWYQEAAG